MTPAVVKPYEKHRARLIECLLAMASHAEEALALAMRALVERDDALVERVVRNDEILDQYEIEVDEVSVRLLAMAPLAGELRLITVAMKISQNLERVGDEAVAIALHAGDLNAEAPLKPYVDLPLMSVASRQMLSEAIAAFIERRSDRARDLLPRDREVDSLNRQLHRELASYMVERPANIPRCLRLMGIAKAFERVADHATTIAQEVVFLYEGKDIRHAALT
ncbi:MAG TPA: phosphate signaling complex protein PhoU [Opitutaceae bacterium]